MAHIRQSRPDSGTGLQTVPQEQKMLKGHAQGTPFQSHISPTILVYEDSTLSRFSLFTRTRVPERPDDAIPCPTRKVDVRLPGKGNSNSHGARPVHLIITMIKWTRTSRLSIKNSLSAPTERLGLPLPSEEGTTQKHEGLSPESRPESGIDCLICAIFARQRTRRGGVPVYSAVSSLGASPGRCRIRHT